jgi:hypothetical protein
VRWRLLLLFLVSAVVGTGCDWLHVRSDVLSYPQPQFYHVPIGLFGLYLHAALLTRTLAALYFTKPSAEQAL